MHITLIAPFVLVIRSSTHTREAAQIAVSRHVFKDLSHYAFRLKEKRTFEGFFEILLTILIKVKHNNNGYHFVNSLLHSFAVIGAYGVLRYVGSAYVRIFINLPF